MTQPTHSVHAKRRTTIIKGSFQTPYVALIALFVGALTFLMFWDFSQFMKESVLVNPTRQDLRAVFDQAFWWFCLRFSLYILSVIFFLFVLLHRVAGPVVRFSRLALAVGSGDLTQRVHLRKFDGMKNLQGEFNSMVDSLHETVKTDRHLLTKALEDLSRIKGHTLPPETRSQLDLVQDSLAKVLKTFKL